MKVTDAQAIEKDFEIVPLSDIPTSKANAVAVSLLKAIEALSEQNSLRVRLRKFPKSALQATQRYAATKGLRVGLKFSEEYA